MANFKQVAADAGFKGRFSRAASFGWFVHNGSRGYAFVREATGVTIKDVLTIYNDESETNWGIGDIGFVGFVVKETPNSSEIFVFFNTNEELEQVRKSFIVNYKMTARKRIKEFKMGKAWKV